MNTIITQVLRPVVNLLFVAATVIFTWGVIEYVAKSDSEDGRTIGRRHMIWGIVGLVIMFTAVAVVEIFKNFWTGIT
jgi:FtsH-binding integral membrane protein